MVHGALNQELLLGKLTDKKEMLVSIECRSCLCMQLETTYRIQFNIHFYHYYLYFIHELQKNKIPELGAQ